MSAGYPNRLPLGYIPHCGILSVLLYTCVQTYQIIFTSIYKTIYKHCWLARERGGDRVPTELFSFAVAVNNSIKERSFGFLVINVCSHGEHYETAGITLTSIYIDAM